MATLDEGETVLDEAALDAFADRMIGVLNDGCTALMTSIGHQTGLFGTLASYRPAGLARPQGPPARRWAAWPRLPGGAAAVCRGVLPPNRRRRHQGAAHRRVVLAPAARDAVRLGAAPAGLGR
jgi:hypothetical protein